MELDFRINQSEVFPPVCIKQYKNGFHAKTFGLKTYCSSSDDGQNDLAIRLSWVVGWVN